MEIKGYCISSIDALKLEDSQYAQLTLNGRIYPGKRDYAKLLSDLEYKPELYLHCDFIYTMSRIAILSERVKADVLGELKRLSDFANSPSNKGNKFKGIVMHIEIPIRKEVLDNPSEAKLNEFYNKPLYDMNAVKRCMEGSWKDELIHTLKEVQDFIGVTDNFNIYLENAPRLYNGTGSYAWIVDILNTNTLPLYRPCLDLEHSFASGIDFGLVQIQEVIKKKCLIHLNTIPKKVKLGSNIDDHSSTTVYECSQKGKEFYEDLLNILHQNNIPYIREIKEVTRSRENEQHLI